MHWSPRIFLPSVVVLAASTLCLCTSISVYAQQDRMKRLDHNGDGKVTEDEMPERFRPQFKSMDTDHDGALSQAELEVGKLNTAASRTPAQGRTKPNGEYYAPPAMQELVPAKLKVGDAAPDFSLRTADGAQTISLSQFKSQKPVVLVFGSITCSPFREKLSQVIEISQRFSNQAEFLMIYIREAHPESTILVPESDQGLEDSSSKKMVLKKFEQTSTPEQRRANAQNCDSLLKVPFPMLIDDTQNTTLDQYGGWPNRLVVIDQNGAVAWDSGQGPRGFEPEKLAAWLRDHKPTAKVVAP